MKKSRIPIILMLIPILISGCDKKDDTGCCGTYFKSFINPYALANSFEAKTLYEHLPNTIIIDYTADYYSSPSPEYDYYSKLYGDTQYNNSLYRPNEALVNEITAIDIISDTDFDETHPGGLLLNDIVKISAITAIPYIESGYEDTYDWPEHSSVLDRGFHPIDKWVSELEPDDLRLFIITGLTFTVIPEIKEHKITVTFYEGTKTLSTTLDFVFE